MDTLDYFYLYDSGEREYIEENYTNILESFIQNITYDNKNLIIITGNNLNNRLYWLSSHLQSIIEKHVNSLTIGASNMDNITFNRRNYCHNTNCIEIICSHFETYNNIIYYDSGNKYVGGQITNIAPIGTNILNISI